MGKKSWWSWPFSEDAVKGVFGYKDEKQGQQEAPKIPQLTDYPVGSAMDQAILAGIGGQDWGFGEDYVNKSTNPLASLTEYNIVLDQKKYADQLSGMGTRKGTAAARDITNVGTLGHLNLNNYIAQVMRENEAQKKIDQQNAYNRGTSWAGMQQGIGSGQAMANYNNTAMNNQIMSANQDYNAQILPRAIGTAMSVATPFVTANQQNELIKTILANKTGGGATLNSLLLSGGL